MVGGSLWVLRLPPPLKLIAMIPEDVKKNHIFPQFFGYIAIYLVPVGGQLCVLGEYILLVS